MVESQSAIIKPNRRERPNRKAGRVLDQRHSTPASSLRVSADPVLIDGRAFLDGWAEARAEAPMSLGATPIRGCARTDLYGITKEKVEEQYNIVDRDCLSFWLFFRTNTGLEFEGSPVDVFWMNKDPGDRGGLTPHVPYRALRKAIKTVLSDTAATCREHALQPDKYIDEAAALLLGLLIDRVYREMVRLECRLRKIPHENEAFRDWEVQEGTRRLSVYLREQVDAVKLLGQPHPAVQRHPSEPGQAGETVPEATPPSRKLANASEPQAEGEQRQKITQTEANVRVRRLLKETPSWDWAVRNLAKQVGCSTGTISGCPAWQAYKDRRDRLRKEGTVNTVSISKEMESVLGTGEKDEVLQQLIAEQVEEQREDAGQAKLYLSHEKKPKRRES